jgi:hypothetical protein
MTIVVSTTSTFWLWAINPRGRQRLSIARRVGQDPQGRGLDAGRPVVVVRIVLDTSFLHGRHLGDGGQLVRFQSGFDSGWLTRLGIVLRALQALIALHTWRDARKDVASFYITPRSG